MLHRFSPIDRLGTNGVRVTHHHSATKSAVRRGVNAGSPLIGTSPKTKAELLRQWTDGGAWMDSWQRHLQIIENENGDLRREAGRILVYSMGSDGKSESNGNDPDDINSWDDHHLVFYRNKIEQLERNRNLKRSVCLTPFLHAAILWLHAMFRRASGQTVA